MYYKSGTDGGQFPIYSTFMLEICDTSLIRRPRSLCSLWNFALELTMRKLELWGYPPVKTP